MGKKEQNLMTSNILLSLDLSLSRTGYAIFDLKSKKLITFGAISPSKKGLQGIEYPKQQVIRMRRLVSAIKELIEGHQPHTIVIEETNRGIARISQKILCGLHFVLLDSISEKALDSIMYVDSDGKKGWRSRSGLALQLNEADRMQNKEIRKFNRQVKKGKKLKIKNIKDRAIEFANEYYGLSLETKNNDIADAIGLGHHYVHNILKAAK